MKIDSFRDEYSFLSNFYPSIVEFEGHVYPTVENAYQAAKCENINDRKQFLNIKPGHAKRLGAKIKRKNWFDINIEIMKQLLTKKFSDQKLREKLLATGNNELIEGNNWNDIFWGVCNGIGENHLGKLLMQVREELK